MFTENSSDILLYFLMYRALRMKQNTIHYPVIPQPIFEVNKIELYEGKARFWFNSKFSEFRNCPIGDPGNIIMLRKTRIQIQNVQIKKLQLSDNVYKWDECFRETRYEWKKNPWIWIIDFIEERKPLHQKNVFFPPEMNQEALAFFLKKIA